MFEFFEGLIEKLGVKLIEMRNDKMEWCIIADYFRTTETAVRVKHSMIKRRYK